MGRATDDYVGRILWGDAIELTWLENSQKVGPGDGTYFVRERNCLVDLRRLAVLTDRYTTTDPNWVLWHAYLSDVGKKRSQNEDAVGFFMRGQPVHTFLLVVADGVGGNVAGEVASQLAVEAVNEGFFRRSDAMETGQALHEAIVAANQIICQEAAANPHQAGMATTCTAAVIQGATLVLGHVGDCRAYLTGDGSLRQLTDDHSVAAEYARRGAPVPPEKEVLANVLTRWLGADTDVEVDISETIQMQEESNLVLCSDGLTKVVSPDEILHLVSLHLPGPACQHLVKLACDRGGPDNITVQVARLGRAA